MRKLLVVSLILAAIVLSVLMLTGPGTAQASPAVPNRLLAATLTPTPDTRVKLPPSGAVPPTPTAGAPAPDKLPPSGGSQPDSGSGLMIVLGGLLVVGGGLILSRRRSDV